LYRKEKESGKRKTRFFGHNILFEPRFIKKYKPKNGKLKKIIRKFERTFQKIIVNIGM
jgi:arsenate reductase-like glutaredoxin family protein